MAPKQMPVSTKELKAAQETIDRANRAGVLDAAPSSSGYGGMSDATKRLREPEDWEVEEWEAIAYQEQKALAEERFQTDKSSSQMPVLKKDPKAFTMVTFPPGIDSMEDWSTTICRLPKVSKMNLTYAEMTETLSLESYLTWVQQHGIGKGGRFEDLAQYLNAIDFHGKKNSTDRSKTFPGRDRGS